MSCEQYQSLPMDERSPNDQLAIELAKVFFTHVLSRGTRLKPSHSSLINGVDALDATQLSS
jgi:hypothetical protein